MTGMRTRNAYPSAIFYTTKIRITLGLDPGTRGDRRELCMIQHGTSTILGAPSNMSDIFSEFKDDKVCARQKIITLTDI